MAKQDKPTKKDQKAVGKPTGAFSYKGEPSDMRKKASQLEADSRVKKMLARGLTNMSSRPETKSRTQDTVSYALIKTKRDGVDIVQNDFGSNYTSKTAKKRAGDWLNKAKQDSTNASNLRKQANAIDKKRSDNAMNIIKKSAGISSKSAKIPYKKK